MKSHRILTDKQLEAHTQHKHILSTVATDALGPLLLTWINFNPGMDK